MAVSGATSHTHSTPANSSSSSSSTSSSSTSSSSSSHGYPRWFLVAVLFFILLNLWLILRFDLLVSPAHHFTVHLDALDDSETGSSSTASAASVALKRAQRRQSVVHVSEFGGSATALARAQRRAAFDAAYAALQLIEERGDDAETTERTDKPARMPAAQQYRKRKQQQQQRQTRMSGGARDAHPHRHEESTGRLVREQTMRDPAVVVMAFNRPDMLKRTMESLKALPESKYYTTYVSVDGGDRAVMNVARGFGATALEHERKGGARLEAHEYIARHYGDVLTFLFTVQEHSHVIFVEDDLLLSADFLSLFEQTAGLLDEDPTLFCVSSWNDNALPGFEWARDKLRRTSFFPGLGWMLGRAQFDALPPFPVDQWDHWLRLDGVSKNRECIVPEVSRNFNIGDHGSYMEGDLYRKYFANAVYNKEGPVDFGDVSYLLEDQYAVDMQALVDSATAVVSNVGDLRAAELVNRVVLALYDKESFRAWADHLGIWHVPRAHHRHLHVLQKSNGLLVLLADRRHCPYVPDAHRVKPAPQLLSVAGKEGASCDETCAATSKRCRADQFDFINNCAALADVFPCERGFAMVGGPDIPNYVNSAGDKYYKRCLVTEWLPTCDARHAGNQRLCPCV